ncbi:hypothetical protein [Komagataeibacter europaeus]|nr:hypothetical protein [Komagataeibacter europaeus]
MPRAIQRAECAIVAIEENDIRNFLVDVEGQLELVGLALMRAGAGSAPP